ncbi:MAG: DUF6326 family protein [Luteimonas sp.]
MKTLEQGQGTFVDAKVDVKVRMSALWAGVMFCYVYGDYFGLYVPGKITEMAAGNIGPLGAATQGVLVGVAAMMAIPSIMVFLTLVLKASVNRWLNIVLGTVYTAIILMTMPGAWTFYVFLGVVEAVLTALIVWHAWHWPRAKEQHDHT